MPLIERLLLFFILFPIGSDKDDNDNEEEDNNKLQRKIKISRGTNSTVASSTSTSSKYQPYSSIVLRPNATGSLKQRITFCWFTLLQFLLLLIFLWFHSSSCHCSVEQGKAFLLKTKTP
jgi:hypothetical protein